MNVPTRSAEGAPERFDPVAPTVRVPPADTISASGCTSPMRDPRDGTIIRFIRSATTHADFEVPAGQYGVGPREVLRLDCNTGQVVGVVRR